MNRLSILLAVLICQTLPSHGQVGNVSGIAKLTGDTLSKAKDSLIWKKGGFVNINFSQVSLSQWAPGGEGSFAISSNGMLYANYDKGRIRWDNNINLAYALQKTSSEGLRKTDDQIDLTSKFGYRMKPVSKWYYSTLVNFKSQFSEGYTYPDEMMVSKFLAPAYVITSIGLTYRPLDYFEVLLSPVTSRLVIVNDQQLADAGSYGVKPAVRDASGTIITPGKKLQSQFGAYLNARIRKEIMPNVTLASRLELFNNYTDEVKANRKNIDVNWETGFLMKVNKLITASLIIQVVYDADVIERTQYRQVIGVGFGYKFNNTK